MRRAVIAEGPSILAAVLRLFAVLAALAILALGPAAALAADELPDDVQSVVDDFRADGEITPCKHTVQALERTSQLAPSDIAQYSPDFPAAVEAALEERKRNDCTDNNGSTAGAGAGAAPGATATPPPAAGAATPAPGASATPQATPSTTPQPTPAATPPPATPAATPGEPTYTTVAHTDPFPIGLWILIGLLALSLLAWVVLALLGRTGWGEERLAGPRHAWAEARYRASGVWSDFTDWLRLGR
jgi:hypothetical protein